MNKRLTRAAEHILTQDLKRDKWAGWVLEEAVEEGPIIWQNTRITEVERRNAEKIATRRVLDGETRSHFQGIVKIKCPKCGRGWDGMEHWMFQCCVLGGVRETAWRQLECQVGKWIAKLSRGQVLRLAAGRIPSGAKEIVLQEAEAKPGETYAGTIMRVQAGFVQ